MKSSSAQDIAIAFYKTAGAMPDFENWAKHDEEFQKIPYTRQKAFIDQEKQRLKGIYRDYNPKTDFLVLRVPVNAEIHYKKIDEAGEDSRKNLKAQIKITLDGKEYPDYFPYQHLDCMFALIPLKLKSHLSSTLDINKASYVQSHIRKARKLSLYLQMVPHEAHATEPYFINDMELWPLTTEIASASVWDERNLLVWEYTAPWYISPQTENLMDLYQE